MAKKKDIIRVGDKVKIIQPRFIYRCGWGSACYLSNPGGLNEEKTHKLLRLEFLDGWIEICDVEKVSNV